jgi:Peptidase MA superfamily
MRLVLLSFLLLLGSLFNRAFFRTESYFPFSDAGQLLYITETPPSSMVESDEVIISLPEKITFSLQASNPAQKIKKVVLNYGFEQLSCQEMETTREAKIEPAYRIQAEWEIDFKDSGAVYPGTNLWHRWEITASDGSQVNTPVQWLIVRDQRHSWQTLTKGKLELSWYRGDRAFGEYLMGLLQKTLRRLSADFGIQIADPIRVTVYPTAEELRQILVFTYDWTGAVAVPEKGLILLPVQPGWESWAGEVVPHEVTHLAVARLVFNCAGIDIPTWLDEGLAMYMEGPLAADSSADVIAALQQGRLSSLRSLVGSFSAYSDEASIQYSQSQMVADFLVTEFGGEKMGNLLSTIKTGSPIDQAMEAVYGFDTDGLDARWRKSLGYEITLVVKSTPSPEAIPTLALWTLLIKLTSTPSPSPTFTISPSSTFTHTPQPAGAVLPYPGSVTLIPSGIENVQFRLSWSFLLVVASISLAIGIGAIFLWLNKKARQK